MFGEPSCESRQLHPGIDLDAKASIVDQNINLHTQLSYRGVQEHSSIISAEV